MLCLFAYKVQEWLVREKRWQNGVSPSEDRVYSFRRQMGLYGSCYVSISAPLHSVGCKLIAGASEKALQREEVTKSLCDKNRVVEGMVPFIERKCEQRR